MNMSKSLLLAGLGLAFAIASTADASAATRWERLHPRRDQVVDRLQHQNWRIHDERREGEITAAQAHHLHAEDRAIFRQEQFDARLNGGYITKAQQRGFNQAENRVSGQIGQ